MGQHGEKGPDGAGEGGGDSRYCWRRGDGGGYTGGGRGGEGEHCGSHHGLRRVPHVVLVGPGRMSAGGSHRPAAQRRSGRWM